MGKTEGQVRVHCSSSQKVLVGRYRDELNKTIAYLAHRDVITTVDLKNGDYKIPKKHMSCCHKPGCGYASERDCNICTHRKRHGTIENLGRFWGTLKSLVR